MALILTVVLIVCMLWLFAALPVPAVAPYAIYHPLLAWICVAIIAYFVIAGDSTRGRLGRSEVSPSIGAPLFYGQLNGTAAHGSDRS